MPTRKEVIEYLKSLLAHELRECRDVNYILDAPCIMGVIKYLEKKEKEEQCDASTLYQSGAYYWVLKEGFLRCWTVAQARFDYHTQSWSFQLIGASSPLPIHAFLKIGKEITRDDA